MSTKAPAAVRDRRTSQTLGMILERLAKRSRVKQDRFAEDIGVTRGALHKVFNGDNGVTYKLLEKYERRLGVPTGVILCISHSAALIHHAAYSRDSDERQQAEAALNRMVKYLANLRAVLIKPARHPKRLKYIKQGIPHGPLWIDLIDEIMDATRGTRDPLSPTEFTDPQFIANEQKASPEQKLNTAQSTRKKLSPRRANAQNQRPRKRAKL